MVAIVAFGVVLTVLADAATLIVSMNVQGQTLIVNVFVVGAFV